MPDSLHQLKSLLREQGYSMTKSREIVFMALQHREPQTMNKLVLTCRKKTDRASVYRTIALFEKLDIVYRIQMGWKYKLELSDIFSRHHHHATCVRCGATVATKNDDLLEKRIETLADSQGFDMQNHQLEIYGVCKNCQTNY